MEEALHENPLILALTQFAHRWKAGEGWGSGAIRKISHIVVQWPIKIANRSTWDDGVSFLLVPAHLWLFPFPLANLMRFNVCIRRVTAMVYNIRFEWQDIFICFSGVPTSRMRNIVKHRLTLKIKVQFLNWNFSTV